MGTAETRACKFRFESGGYVVATMNEGATFELEDARDAVAATWQVAGERRGPVVVDSRGLRMQTRAARLYFTSEEVAGKVSAVAIVVESPVSRAIGSFFLRIGKHHIPTRLFTDLAAARSWAMDFVQ